MKTQDFLAGLFMFALLVGALIFIVCLFSYIWIDDMEKLELLKKIWTTDVFAILLVIFIGIIADPLLDEEELEED